MCAGVTNTLTYEADEGLVFVTGFIPQLEAFVLVDDSAPLPPVVVVRLLVSPLTVRS